MRPLLTSVVALAACARPAPPQVALPPVSSGKVRVRVFTEPAPVRLLASAGRYVFVATDRDLHRWDERGAVLPVVAGKRIIAIAPDVDRRWVWIVTDAGLAHYDPSTETLDERPAPTPLDAASVAPGDDDTAWVGTTSGLWNVARDGTWSATSLKEPVQALARDRTGWLWIATRTGLVARKPTGELVRIGPLEGCDVTSPRMLVELPGDRMLVIGADDDDRDRLAFGRGTQWATYRALPDARFDAAARRGDGAVLLAGDRLYRVAPVDPARVRPLARDGMRLAPAAPWTIEPTQLVLPPGAMTLATVDDQLLIGTRELGTARYREGDARPHDWLRRRQMFLDASTLSVACATRDDCWIATGTRQSWHWNGEQFAPRGPDDVVLAVVRDPAGAIYALHRAPDATTIAISRIDGTTWIPRHTLPAREIRFARFATTGVLVLGLDEGIVTLDLGSGKLARTSDAIALDGEVRGEIAWLATERGIARIAAGTTEHWPDEARAIAIAGEAVYAATPTGAARWDAKQRTWLYPPALGFAIRDLVATRSGQLWMATQHGVAAWDGTKLRRLDTRRGLTENVVLDVAADHFDRIWARGAGSLALITP